MTQPNQTGTCPTCKHNPISLRMIACPMCGSRLPWADSPAPQPVAGHQPTLSTQATVAPQSVITSPNYAAPASFAPPGAFAPPETAQGTGGSWHYVLNGSRVGPVSLHEIPSLIAQGKITIESSVWRNGMVNWLPARQTELVSYFSSGQQPPVVAGGEVNNGVAWLLAFEPILFYLCVMMMASSGLEIFVACVIAGIPCAVLNSWDERVLRNAGYEVSKNAFVTTFTPAYLFMRAGRLKQSNGYAWVCSVLLLITFGMFLQNAPAGPKKHYQAMILDGYNEKLDGIGSSTECSSVELTKTGEDNYDGTITCSDGIRRRATIRPRENGQVEWLVIPEPPQ